jgi:hypothetical protein
MDVEPAEREQPLDYEAPFGNEEMPITNPRGVGNVTIRIEARVVRRVDPVDH